MGPIVLNYMVSMYCKLHSLLEVTWQHLYQLSWACFFSSDFKTLVGLHSPLSTHKPPRAGGRQCTFIVELVNTILPLNLLASFLFFPPLLSG